MCSKHVDAKTRNDLQWATMSYNRPVYPVFNTFLMSRQGNLMLGDYQASYKSLKILVMRSILLAILNVFFDFVALEDLSFKGCSG